MYEKQTAEHIDVHLWGQAKWCTGGLSFPCLMENFYNELDKTMFVLEELVYDICRNPKAELFELYPSGSIMHREYTQ